jgi:hypothetical protein
MSRRVCVGLGPVLASHAPSPPAAATAAWRGRSLVPIAGWSYGGVGPERGLRGEEEGGGVRSGPGEARTILLLHIISVRPSKQPLMVRTFLKVYMELGSYFLFLQEQIKDIIIEPHALHTLLVNLGLQSASLVSCFLLLDRQAPPVPVCAASRPRISWQLPLWGQDPAGTCVHRYLESGYRLSIRSPGTMVSSFEWLYF